MNLKKWRKVRAGWRLREGDIFVNHLGMIQKTQCAGCFAGTSCGNYYRRKKK